MPSPDYTVVLVKWVDSHLGTGWTFEDEARELAADAERLECLTCGFLIADNEVGVTIAHSTGKNQVADPITIPRCSIKSIHTLTRGKARKK